MTKYSLYFGIITLFFTSCSTPTETGRDTEENTAIQLTEEAELAYLEKGEQITSEMQSVLMKNVQEAMQKGGPEYAVDFCNLNAIPLTDSMSNILNATIQRKSDRNRNPNNAISSELDQMAWNKIKETKKPLVQTDNNGHAFYYKPIQIGMPTCLKCHGTKEEISEGTAKIIAEKYPNDKATGYHEGDLRGMWKVGIGG